MKIKFISRARVGMGLNVAGIMGTCLVLLIALYYQVVLYDMPCPLCLLQRVGLIMGALALTMNVRFGEKSIHYALALLAALCTGIISSRQVMLHIAPGSGSYGLTFFGLHFYTWALLYSVATIIYVAGMLALFNPIVTAHVEFGRSARLTVFFLTALAVINLGLTLLQCGSGQCGGNLMLYNRFISHLHGIAT